MNNEQGINNNVSDKNKENTSKFTKGVSGNKNGRPKGSKGKFTDLKKVFMDVFARMQAHQGNWQLQKWGEENPKEFYYLISKMLPSKNESTNEIEISFRHWKEAQDKYMAPNFPSEVVAK